MVAKHNNRFKSVFSLIRCCVFGLEEIYKAVTGQEADIDRLNAIEDLFSLYD